MLIGYVSDERFVALADVLLEFQRDGQTVTIVRSTPFDAVLGARASWTAACLRATHRQVMESAQSPL